MGNASQIVSFHKIQYFFYGNNDHDAKVLQIRRAAPLAIIRQLSRKVSRGSSGEYQAVERAGVARLYWRVSGR